MIERTTTAVGRQTSGYFSLEGTRLHERAVRAGIPIAQVLVGESFARDTTPRIQRLLASLRGSGCGELLIVPDGVMAEATNGRGLGAILGLVKLPPRLDLGEILTQRRGDAVGKDVLLVLVDVVDPGNVGAMVRTAHALGATAVAPVGVSDPFHPKAVRTAMGSLFKLPVVAYADYSALADDLARLAFVTVATAVAGGTPLSKTTISSDHIALLMGNEYHGLPDVILDTVDYRVTIPMVEGVDSLSVNAATAVCFYEMTR